MTARLAARAKRKVRKHHEWIAHYHTGGLPGRHELDETQELN